MLNMSKLIWFLFGVLVAVIIQNRIYDKVISTIGLAHLAGYGYQLGCNQAKGDDCKLKSEAYTNKLQEIMGMVNE